MERRKCKLQLLRRQVFGIVMVVDVDWLVMMMKRIKERFFHKITRSSCKAKHEVTIEVYTAGEREKRNKTLLSPLLSSSFFNTKRPTPPPPISKSRPPPRITTPPHIAVAQVTTRQATFPSHYIYNIYTHALGALAFSFIQRRALKKCH
jgi:hypothetical protein